MGSRENLTEVLAHARAPRVISAVPESQMVIFGPKNPTYTITCSPTSMRLLPQLHSEMAE